MKNIKELMMADDKELADLLRDALKTYTDGLEKGYCGLSKRIAQEDVAADGKVAVVAKIVIEEDWAD